MANESILKHHESGISVLRIHRLEKKNALTLQMYRELTASLKQAESDPEVFVHLILGEESVFSAGHDIQDFVQGIGGDSSLNSFWCFT